MRLLSSFIFMLVIGSAIGQNSFTDKAIGVWRGQMSIHQKGVKVDSVDIEFTVAKTDTSGVWVWKTQYLSVKYPILKDYLLRLKDKSTSHYIIDEGDNLVLDCHIIGDKMYSTFETNGNLLTASYEFINDKFIFEVTMARRNPKAHPTVDTYYTSVVQRVVMERVR